MNTQSLEQRINGELVNASKEQIDCIVKTPGIRLGNINLRDFSYGNFAKHMIKFPGFSLMTTSDASSEGYMGMYEGMWSRRNYITICNDAFTHIENLTEFPVQYENMVRHRNDSGIIQLWEEELGTPMLVGDTIVIPITKNWYERQVGYMNYNFRSAKPVKTEQREIAFEIPREF